MKNEKNTIASDFEYQTKNNKTEKFKVSWL